MLRLFSSLVAVAWATSCWALSAEESKLPPAVTRPVDFEKEIKPLLEASCVKCHAKGKEKGGLSIETRASLLKGGDTGPGLEAGQSGKSLIVEMVAGVDPDSVMPKKGERWTAEQVGLLRGWIDQGAAWPESISFARPAPLNLAPPVAGQASGGNAVDEILTKYTTAHGATAVTPVEDRLFLRRAYLDGIGLLPTPEQTKKFLENPDPAKRAALVRELLSDRRGYADHWLSFWNDLLRNDYRGTGFIDGGRKQISEWLYTALLGNKPYNQFVAELVNPGDKAEGFTAGIIWRGTVNASMSPPMQAAQSVSQVFLGINLKCASCHDSFVSDWTLADAYGMAAVFAKDPLELVHCDKPTGQKAALRFLYPELGKLDATAGKGDRLAQFASLMISPQNGRLSRTLVNRLWAKLYGRGLVEPVDDMEKPAWSSELLDGLASDFERHGYDVKHTLEMMMCAQAYSWPTVEEEAGKGDFVFRGPLRRRLSAEQFTDAISQMTGNWAELPDTLEFDLTGGGVAGSLTLPTWIWTGEPMALGAERTAQRAVRARRAAEEKTAADAQAKAEAKAPEAEAAKEAAAKAKEEADATEKWAEDQHGEVRHRVVFRKHFQLPGKPTQAYGTVLASQGYEVALNGNLVRHKMADGARSGRVRLYDFRPYLQAGENVLVISIESHTEKMMNDTERKQNPESTQHLNPRSGFACYLRAIGADGAATEIVSDLTWRGERAPDGAWMDAKLVDSGWAAPVVIPPERAPVDEGPGLPPLRRADFANIPVELGAALRSACSTAALAGRARASMLAADPVQVALDRPNHEIVITGRANTATTLQALELTNGSTLASELEAAGPRLAKETSGAEACAERMYEAALSRPPTAPEKQIAVELLGEPVRAEGVSDLLWAITMLPEFQIIR